MKGCTFRVNSRLTGFCNLVLIALLVGPGEKAHGQTCTPLSANIVAWWRAENNLLDSIGGKSAILVGSETFGPGRVGLGFSGDGLGDGVLVTNVAPIQLQTLTIEAWVKRGSNSQVSQGSGGAAALVGFGPGGYFFWMDASGNLAFNRLGDGASYSAAGIHDTNFHHVAVTVGGNQLNFYIDGATAAAVNFNTSFSFSGGLGIGYRPDTGDNSFLGTIDEVSIYSRALEPEEVLAVYNAGAGGKCLTHEPSILQQPLSQSHLVGRSAIFSALASGNEPLLYNWTFNGTNIVGATDRSLTLTNLQLSQAGNYGLVVSNTYGWAVSSNGVLTVTTATCLPPPSGIVSWWGAEADAQDWIGIASGILVGNESFAAGEIGLGFVGDGSGDGVLVTNTAALQLATFTIEGWVRRGSTSRVSNGSGGNAALVGFGPGGYLFYLDAGGHLTFGKLGDATTVVSAVAITDQNFHHLAVSVGAGLLRFFVDGLNATTVSYNPTFTYSSSFGIGFRPDNADNSFLGIIDEVSVYNRALSSEEVQAIYEISGAGKCLQTPVIIFQPSNQVVFEGMNVGFSVVASRASSLTYQWRFNGTNLSGATDSSLNLFSVQFSQAGNYSVLVSNVYGFAVSSNAVLTVSPAPLCAPVPLGIVGWWRGQSNALDYAGNGPGLLVGNERYGAGNVGQGFAGDGSGDGVLVTNTTALQLQTLTLETWVKRSSASVISFGTGGNAALVGFGPGGYLLYLDSGGHVVFNKLGENPAIISAAAITDTSFHHLAVSVGSGTSLLYLDGTNTDSAAFSPDFTFSTGFGIGYRPDNGDNSFFGILDEVSVYERVLSATEIKAIYNASHVGKCYSSTKPLILRQPSSQSPAGGETATLAVTVSGDPPMWYQWYFNGTRLANATNSIFLIDNIQPHDAGLYSVVITNALGSTTSSNAEVKVRIVSVYANGEIQTNSKAIYSEIVTIQLSNYYSDGYIFYTLDGTAPTPFSQLYLGPIVVSNSVVLRTLAFSGDFIEFAESGPAEFLIVPSYRLNASTPGGGSIDINPSASGYTSNTLVTITATPSNGWTFLQWLGDAYGTDQTNTVLLDRDKSIQAIFGTTVGKSSSGGGSVAFNPPGPVFPYGYTLMVSAVPLPGNVFVLWGKSASGTTNPLPFAVFSPNPSVSALFASNPPNQFSLAVSPVGDGTVVINPRTNLFSMGQAVTIIADPDPGKIFRGWSGDATGSQNPLNLFMTNNKVIYANFSTDDRLFIYLNGSKVSAGVHVDLVGEIGIRYRLDASTNLTTWTELLGMTNLTGSLHYLDLGTSNQPQKFYRAVILP